MERIEDFKLIREFQRGFLYINSCLTSLLLARIRGNAVLRNSLDSVLFGYRNGRNISLEWKIASTNHHVTKNHTVVRAVQIDVLLTYLLTIFMKDPSLIILTTECECNFFQKSLDKVSSQEYRVSVQRTGLLFCCASTS